MGNPHQPPPPNQKQTTAPDRTIVVQLIDRGASQAPGLKINQDDESWDTLQNRLTDIFKTRAERVVFVKADPGLDFQWVAKAIDIAHGAAIDKVGLMTAKVEAGQ